LTTTLVTGGSSGIGRAIAQELKNDGHEIIVVDIEPAEDELADLHITADLSSESGVETIIESISAREVKTSSIVQPSASGPRFATHHGFTGRRSFEPISKVQLR